MALVDNLFNIFNMNKLNDLFIHYGLDKQVLKLLLSSHPRCYKKFSPNLKESKFARHINGLSFLYDRDHCHKRLEKENFSEQL